MPQPIFRETAFRIAAVLSCLLAVSPLWGSNRALSPHDYQINRGETGPIVSGRRALTAADATVSMSMIGWGLGSAIAIGVIAGVVHRSAEEHSHAHAHAHTHAEPINPPNGG